MSPGSSPHPKRAESGARSPLSAALREGDVPGEKTQAKPRIPGGAAAAIPYLWARERAEALFDT